MEISDDVRSKCINNLRIMMNQIYQIISEYKVMPLENKSYIEGYMRAGRTLNIISKEDLDNLMEEENQKVFGMSITKRKKTIKSITVSIFDEKYLEIPAVIRRGVNIW